MPTPGSGPARRRLPLSWPWLGASASRRVCGRARSTTIRSSRLRRAGVVRHQHLRAGLRFEDRDRRALGARFSLPISPLRLPDSILTLRGRVAWSQRHARTARSPATFQALPGASFTVGGAAQASDAALPPRPRSNANGPTASRSPASFEGEFSNVTRSYAGRGTALLYLST